MILRMTSKVVDIGARNWIFGDTDGSKEEQMTPFVWLGVIEAETRRLTCNK